MIDSEIWPWAAVSLLVALLFEGLVRTAPRHNEGDNHGPGETHPTFAASTHLAPCAARIVAGPLLVGVDAGGCALGGGRLRLSAVASLCLTAAIGIVLAAASIVLGLAARSLRRWRRGRPRRRSNASSRSLVSGFAPRSSRRAVVAARSATRASPPRWSPRSKTIRFASPSRCRSTPSCPWKSLALASLLGSGVGLGVGRRFGAELAMAERRRSGHSRRRALHAVTCRRAIPAVKEGESLVVQINVEAGRGPTVIIQHAAPGRRRRRMARRASCRSRAKTPGRRPRGRLRGSAGANSPSAGIPRRGRIGGKARSIASRFFIRSRSSTDRRPFSRRPLHRACRESVTRGGDITALVGFARQAADRARSRSPQTAWLEMQDSLPTAPREEPPARANAARDRRQATDGRVRSRHRPDIPIVAKAADGMELPKNKHRRLRRQDEPPQVWFESPSEAIEVHTLAEMLMRIRASDDFGLSRAGIMFEVNNEEEYPLLARRFCRRRPRSCETTGKLSPQTRATLEKVLPLEHFELSQQDSVMYYAFAEDIAPASPADRNRFAVHRHSAVPPQLPRARMPERAMGQRAAVQNRSEEIIARQRYALNRTIQLDRKQQHEGQADLPATDSLIKFEGELAKSTRELAEGLCRPAASTRRSCCFRPRRRCSPRPTRSRPAITTRRRCKCATP